MTASEVLAMLQSALVERSTFAKDQLKDACLDEGFEALASYLEKTSLFIEEVEMSSPDQDGLGSTTYTVRIDKLALAGYMTRRASRTVNKRASLFHNIIKVGRKKKIKVKQ